MASPTETPRVPRGYPFPDAEAKRPQPLGEDELDADTEWNTDWPADDDGDWSGCARASDHEEG